MSITPEVLMRLFASKSLYLLTALLPALTFANEGPLNGVLSFDAVGRPSMLKIHGEGKQLRGQIRQEGKIVTGTISAKLDDLDTGIALRNEHMKNKYLEIGKFPDAAFKLDPLSLPAGEGDFKGIPFKGTLTLHGVEKPVAGFADIVTKNNVQSISATFTTKVGDYGVKSPSFAGITMADDVKVKISLKL
jgi:polyisoprenoid-binding protein YceI